MSEANSPDPAEGPSGQLLTDAERQVESLVERYVEQLQAGQPPDRAALVADHPDLAPLLDRRLALVEKMHATAQAVRAAAAAALPPRVQPPERGLHLQCPHCGNRIQLV